MDKYIENIGCPKCGSSDAMGVYQKESGEYYGNCFSCNTRTEDPYDSIEITEKKVEEPLYNLFDADFHPLITRGVSQSVCEQYGVLSILNTNGIDAAHFYPHLDKEGNQHFCMRIVENKKFKWISKSVDSQLFGQDKCGTGGRMIIITEGVCDTLAAVEMLKKSDKQYRVVSVVNGSKGAVKDVKNNYEWLSSFENIFTAFDQDKPGQDAANEVAQVFPPNKVKNLTFSENDPNSLLLSGKYKEFLQSIFSAKESRPTGIVSVEDIFDEAITPPIHGKSFPWPTLTDCTYGYRTGELWGIGAGSGCGKTEFFKEMINHTIYTHNEVAGVIFLEEPAAKTLKVLAGKRVNKRFHIPQDKGGDWTLEELVDGINDLKGKVYLFNHFGSKDWESIKGKIRFMVSALGVKSIFLDHLTALVAQEDNEYKALNRLMEEMSSLCQELDCTIFYVSHLRKASGTPHEEGGRVTADQFKGSGAIVFWSNFLIGLERNQQADDEEERNTTTLRVLKDRNTGLATGVTFQLKYDHTTGRWMELDEDELNEQWSS